MSPVVLLVLGIVAGGISAFAVSEAWRGSLKEHKRRLGEQAKEIQEGLLALKTREHEFSQNTTRLKAEQEAAEHELEQQRARLKAEQEASAANRATMLLKQRARLKAEQEAAEHELEQQRARLKAEQEAREQDLEQQGTRLKAEQAKLESQVVSYRDLQDENVTLKRDLQNIAVSLRKVQLDRDRQQQRQGILDERAKELGARFLKDNIKWIGASLTPNNFVNCKERLVNVIEWSRGIGLDVPAENERGYLADLRNEYERMVRAAFEREEQARIKRQIREEQRLQKEVERELEQLERQRAAIQAALDKALAEAKDEHSAEVERLRARLAEAEAKAQRAMSQAQMTKAGYVYVISNIGAFGEGVYKIGVTRRLEPMDRVKELGDASVPFPFDVHMMVSSDNAPALEGALHQALHKTRMNKINPRKEFFRTDIEAIRQIVETHHGEVQYVADPEALQYRQSSGMSDEDAEYIEGVYERLPKDDGTPGDDD